MSSKIKHMARRKKDTEIKTGFKEKMAEMLELPKEVMLDLPKLTMIGHRNLIIENYKGLIEYETNKIRINTNAGIIKIIGRSMVIRAITSEDILLEGEIDSLEFLK